jgi:hypothetical protein
MPRLKVLQPLVENKIGKTSRARKGEDNWHFIVPKLLESLCMMFFPAMLDL